MILNTCLQFINSQSSIVSIVKYSHIIFIVFSLVLAVFIFIKAKFNLFSKAFFLFVFTFCLWLIGDYMLWTQSDYSLIYTIWSPLDLIEIVFYIFGIYFALLFVKRSDITALTKISLLLILVMPFMFTVLGLSVEGFNQPMCEAFNNSTVGLYKLISEILLLLVLVYYIIKSIFNKSNLNNRKSNLIVLGSMFLFLSIFGITEYIASTTGFYELNLYSLFLLPIFLIVIIYAVFELDIFRFDILGTQYLVVGLVILIVGQLFFVNGNTDRILTIITVITSVSLSVILFNNLQRESDQRIYIESLSEKLEDYNKKLQYANEKLKGLDKLKTEFVSLASHQLRSPLTAIKGYASMLLEGDYGKINSKVQDPVSRIFESSQNLAKIVEDLLNVSKIEQGGMKYEMAPFDLAEVAGSVSKDLSIVAQNKGLKLNFLSEGSKDCMVSGDRDKIRQVVLNFIDNSLKYTKKGEINVKVERVNDKVVFSVSDTGMGIPADIKETLFHKFSRGDGARMNTSGSGLGLYLAKEIAKAHDGHVWVESEGVNKGSTFYFDLKASI